MDIDSNMLIFSFNKICAANEANRGELFNTGTVYAEIFSYILIANKGATWAKKAGTHRKIEALMEDMLIPKFFSLAETKKINEKNSLQTDILTNSLQKDNTEFAGLKNNKYIHVCMLKLKIINTIGVNLKLFLLNVFKNIGPKEAIVAMLNTNAPIFGDFPTAKKIKGVDKSANFEYTTTDFTFRLAKP